MAEECRRDVFARGGTPVRSLSSKRPRKRVDLLPPVPMLVAEISGGRDQVADEPIWQYVATGKQSKQTGRQAGRAPWEGNGSDGVKSMPQLQASSTGSRTVTM